MLKDGRMETIYGFVRRGAVVCDVGTDHAIIPIELVKNGVCESAVITDISAPSLEKGVNNAKNCKMDKKISAYCTNGTLKVPLDDVTDVIIAGMGGELIAQIISQDTRLCDGRFRFILQPMSKPQFLRSFLSENGFEMLLEKKTEADGRVYSVIVAEYTARISQLTDLQLLFGVTPEYSDENEKKYALNVYRALLEKLKGQESSSTEESRVAAIRTRELIGLSQEFLKRFV